MLSAGWVRMLGDAGNAARRDADKRREPPLGARGEPDHDLLLDVGME